MPVTDGTSLEATLYGIHYFPRKISFFNFEDESELFGHFAQTMSDDNEEAWDEIYEAVPAGTALDRALFDQLIDDMLR